MAGRRRQQYRAFGSFAGPDEYVAPPYLINAVHKKYGRGILLIGAIESDIKEFWRNVEVKASNSGFQDKPPQEVTRQIVDISAKEHVNNGTEEDEVEVLNNEEETRTEQKSYSLSFEKSWEFSGNINVGASFFNAFGVGGPSIGLGGSIKRTKKTLQDLTKEEERSLSQQYSLTGKIKVPPKTKLTVTITTYAVNYKANLKAAFAVSMSNVIPFYYKSGLGKLCCAGIGPTCRRVGYITAEELFQGQNEYNVDGGNITFSRETELSYLAETIEMYKVEQRLQ